MLPNGMSERIFGTPAINTKQAAVEAERAHIERLLQPPRKEVPTFAEWFWGTASDSEEPNGRFWVEWVIGRKNKPGEQMEKKCIYQIHLRPAFGHLMLDEIGVGEIARFRASLIQCDARRGGSAKRGGGKSRGWEDECTQPDALAALPMRELVYGTPAAPWAFLVAALARAARWMF